MALLAHVAILAQSVTGTVRDETGAPVPFAGVRIGGTARSVHADEEGRFRFERLPAGRYIIIAASPGFRLATDSVQITGDEQITLSLIRSSRELDEVVVNATRVDEQSGIAFTNIGQDEIRIQNLGQDVPYLLSQVPGVVVNSDAGNGIGYTGLRVRGSDATRVNITINGVPVNDAESQGTFWVNMPDLLSSVNSIQVQRGVGASANGAGAFGASINLETNRLNEKPYAETILTAGSFNTLRNTIAAGTGLLGNKFSFDARASRIVSDGFVDRAFSRLHSYYLSAGWYGKKSVLKLINFYGAEKTYQAWNLVPQDTLEAGNRSYNELGRYTDEYGRLRHYSDQTDNYSQNNWQLHYVGQLGSRISFNVTGHYTKGRGYYEEYKEDQDFSSYGIVPPVIMFNDSVVQVAGTTDLIRRRWLDNDFAGGIFNVSYRFSRAFSATLGGGYNSYFGKHFGRVMWMRFAGDAESDHRYYFNTANKNDANIYLKANWQPFEALSFFADLQGRRVEYSFLGPDNSDTLDQQKRVLDFFNPKAGLSYRLSGALSLYASAAVGNKEPNRNDFVENKPSNQPKHETMLDVEAGFRMNNRLVRSALNFYFMEYRNQLVLNGEINDVGASKRINVPSSYRRGIELELSVDPVKWLTLRGNVALSSNKIRDFKEHADFYDISFGYEGNRKIETHKLTDISFSPGLVTSGQMLVRPVNGFEVTISHKYVSRQYLDNTSAIERSIDPYSYFDLRLNYRTPMKYPELTLMAGVYNLLSSVYETNGYSFGWVYNGEREFYNYLAPAAPRNFLAGFTLKF